MDIQDTPCVDKFFEEARKVPIPVSLEEVKSTLSHSQNSHRKGLAKSISFPNWEWGIAACLILLLGIASVFLTTRNNPPTELHQTKWVENSSSPFMLLDTYQGEGISYWDTSQTPYPLLDGGIENIRCFQTYMEDTACFLTVALELGQPDFINFALADLTGAIVSQLLVEGRQHQPDSSYNFDLCRLQSGKYELLIQTTQGDKLRKQIVLN